MLLAYETVERTEKYEVVDKKQEKKRLYRKGRGEDSATAHRKHESDGSSDSDADDKDGSDLDSEEEKKQAQGKKNPHQKKVPKSKYFTHITAAEELEVKKRSRTPDENDGEDDIHYSKHVVTEKRQVFEHRNVKKGRLQDEDVQEAIENSEKLQNDLKLLEKRINIKYVDKNNPRAITEKYHIPKRKYSWNWEGHYETLIENKKGRIDDMKEAIEIHRMGKEQDFF